MNNAITVEIQFFLISILWGMLILIAYDILRILRRLIKHNAFAITVQDLLFWMVASLFIFAMIYRENDGILRGFCIMGMTIGIVIYHYLLSNFIVKIITIMIQTLLKPLSMAFKVVMKVCRNIFLRIKQRINFVARRLKNFIKSVKIALIKRKQTSAAKHQKKEQQKALSKKKKAAIINQSD